MSGLRADREQDFLERTLKNLDEYKENHIEEPKYYPYEVTMMLNSLLGILIVPEQKTTILNDIDISFLEEYKGSTEDFFRHMRNSLAHGHFIKGIKVDVSTNEIASIEFIDIDPSNGDITFQMTFSVEQLDALIENIRNKVCNLKKSKLR